ncbi:MAG TPA: N-acetyltransferase [Hyphomicrobiaceae bacterium]|nr:N-acetyltransferase [Hyphomicrobiaceae bacterium]
MQPVAPNSIRTARPSDAQAIASLEAGLFESAWNAGAVQRIIAANTNLILVAEPAPDVHERRCPNDLIGFAIGAAAADEFEILSIGVAPAWRRRRVGRSLLARLQEGAAAGGAARIFLEVDIGNAGAQALYRGEGFVEVGRRIGYYGHADGSRSDARILAKDL